MPLTWRADWPDCKPVESLVHRGTDVELQPTWYINGAAAATNGWTFTTYVQTNAVGQWFGPLPGAYFSHTNDVGAAFYSVMVRAQGADGGVNYTAFARFRMLDSPGFTPGELPLPAKTIDFADVTVLNPPWAVDASITNGFVTTSSATNIAEAVAASATNALDVSLSSRLSRESQNSTNYTDTAIAAATNGIPRITESESNPGWAANSERAETAVEAGLSTNAQYADEATYAANLSDGDYQRDATTIFAQLDAATATNAAQSAQIAALQASQTNFATKADATLTPIYSQWVCDPPTNYNGARLSINYADWQGDGWYVQIGNNQYSNVNEASPDATELTWPVGEWGESGYDTVPFRAVRHIAGYQLGSQSTKPLQPQGDYAQASVLADIAETVTNALETAGAAAAASSTNSANIATLNAQVSSIAQSATNYTDSAISTADTSYRRVYSLTNLNQTVQFVELDETQTSLAIELPTTGDTKDWLVYVYAATNATLSLPSGVTWWTSDAANTNAIDAATPTALYFSQVSTNIFMFGRQALESVGGAQ